MTTSDAIRSAKTVQLLEIVICEGTGLPNSPIRLVTHYYRPDGEHVATSEPRSGHVHRWLETSANKHDTPLRCAGCDQTKTPEQQEPA